MATRTMQHAAEKVIEEGGSLADALDVAILAHLGVSPGDYVQVGMTLVRKDEIRRYFEITSV